MFSIYNESYIMEDRGDDIIYNKAVQLTLTLFFFYNNKYIIQYS